MIAVIFEVRAVDGCEPHYLDMAAALRPQLQEIDGFISVERFRSVADPGKLLSLSFFRDEASVTAWRTLLLHRAAQSRGREELFADYRIRIAAVIRDYGMNERREQAPVDSSAYHDPSA